MKRLVLLSLTLALVASLMPLASTPAAPVSAQDDVTISFVHTFFDENDIRFEVVQSIVEEFEAQNRGITVEVQTKVDYDEILDSTLTAIDQGNAPHVVQLDETATRFAADQVDEDGDPLFVKLQDVATEEQQANFDDLLPSVRDFFEVDGELWSMPWNSSNPVLYINEDIFTAAGLDPANPPRTFAEVDAVCATIMEQAEALELSGCINWPLAAWFPETWVAMQGGLVVNNENGHDGRATEALLNSEEMQVAVEWWASMAEQGYYIYTGVTGDYTGEAGLFITQGTAMHINSTAGVSNFVNFAGIFGYGLTVAPLPIPNEDATNGTINGGGSLWITNGHSEAEINAARDFVFFMTSAENIAEWHKDSGYFPNRQASIDILEAEGFWEENPAYRVAVDQLVNTVPNAATAGAIYGSAPTVRGYLVDAIQSVIDGGESVEDALAAADTLADEQIEEYNLFFAME